MKIIIKTTIYLNHADADQQDISSQKEQTAPLQDDIRGLADLITRRFSRTGHCKNETSNWITHPYSANGKKVQKKPL
ncbi:hypothetical protein [Ornithobacterium rhinotracheale]|uniref:hypothetical protein n=1 Tax=Ornithobacterium rhinotracheale TaxID=28251 RepID=UPI001FF2CC4C|nr:hypothetical protein [Ornithobacterium rhinotracheale]MCK0203527.1 hypothetical protein [Ornithobacterium rhinotracheale]